MGWLKSAQDNAQQWWTGDSKSAASETYRTSEQQALGNAEVQVRSDVGETPDRAGTVVAKAGDTVSGLASAGIGDAKRYTELNLFNNRAAEDASLEPLDILYVPMGWDVVAMGGVAEAVPAETEVTQESPDVATAQSPLGTARDTLGQAAEQGASWVKDKASAAYAAWLGGETGSQFENAHNASRDAQRDIPEAGATSRDDVDFVKKENGHADQTVDVGEDGALDSTLDLAETRADLGDAGTHYKREGATTADKMAQARGDSDRDTFWCSGFSLWTLGAAGYDMEKPLVGSNGEAHGYVDANGYMPIKPFMLIDGQWEAVQAMGRILKQTDDLATVPGYTLWISTNAVRDLEGEVRTVGRSPASDAGTLIAEGESDVDTGFSDLDLYEEGTTDSTTAREDYDDSLAVMGAAGAFELMNIGHRVNIDEMKPGDFGQTFYKNGGKYWGKGHAYQIWSVTVMGAAWFGEPGSPKLVDGSEYTTRTWLEDVEFVIDKDTDASLVGTTTTLKDYKSIEANIGGAAGTDLSGDGGVDITDDRSPESQGGSESEDRRSYYGRLFENPWSEKNWAPATGPSAEPTSPEVTESNRQDTKGALDPLWQAIGWE